MPRGRPRKRPRFNSDILLNENCSNDANALNIVYLNEPDPGNVSHMDQPIRVVYGAEEIAFTYNKLKELKKLNFGCLQRSVTEMTADACHCSVDRVYEVVPDSRENLSLRQLLAMDDDDEELIQELDNMTKALWDDLSVDGSNAVTSDELDNESDVSTDELDNESDVSADELDNESDVSADEPDSESDVTSDEPDESFMTSDNESDESVVTAYEPDNESIVTADEPDYKSVVTADEPDNESVVTTDESVMTATESVVTADEPDNESVVTADEPDNESVVTTDESVVTATESVVTADEPDNESVVTIEKSVVTADEPEDESVSASAEEQGDDITLDQPLTVTADEPLPMVAVEKMTQEQPNRVSHDKSVSVAANEELGSNQNQPDTVTDTESDFADASIPEYESDSLADASITDYEPNSVAVAITTDEDATTSEDSAVADLTSDGWPPIPSPPIHRMQPVVWWDDGGQTRSQRLDLNDVEIGQLHLIVNGFCGPYGRMASVARVMDKMRADLEDDNWRFESEEELLAALYAAPGFDFPKTASGERCVVETEVVLTTRRQFLRAMGALKGDPRPVVYVAESWIEPDALGDTVRHRGQHSWHSPAFNEPVGPYGRVLISAAASHSQGLIPNSIRFTGFRTGILVDMEMLKSWYRDWFLKLCQKLKDRSVIVADAAPHRWVARHFPHSSKTVSNFLYELDIIAMEHGHRVLCAPQFHSSFNPLQQIMTDMKRQVHATVYSWKHRDTLDLMATALKNYLKDNRKWQERVKLAWYASEKL